MYTGLPSCKTALSERTDLKDCDGYLVHFMVVLRIVLIDLLFLREDKAPAGEIR